MSTFSKFFSSETSGPIEAKFHVEPPLDGETKVCSNSLGHMTNMAAMPVCGKTVKSLLLRNQKADDLETWCQNRVLENYQVCSNDDPGLT